MGAVYIKLKFAKDTPAAAKYRVVADGGNLAYGDKELDRNDNFKLRAKGTVVATSDTIVARRVLHYQLVRMADVFDATDKSEIDDIVGKVVDKLWKDERSVRLIRVDDCGEVAAMAVYDVVDSKGKKTSST